MYETYACKKYQRLLCPCGYNWHVFLNDMDMQLPKGYFIAVGGAEDKGEEGKTRDKKRISLRTAF